MSEHTGTERRIHRVYVTRNTEYHLRQDQCVGVRDLRTGLWMQRHRALRQRLRGSLRFTDSGIIPGSIEQPIVGESLYFQAGDQDVVTSVITAVQRPARRIVHNYQAAS